MTARDFCYWLNGHFELNGDSPYKSLSAEQVDLIKRHLSLVFIHDLDKQIDGGDGHKKAILDASHHGGKGDRLRC